ncbi:MAG: c-type cytochrome [Candidatus Nealsonbacteria bacterium]|nr:c-type cytochrome [Candidatus Nealsonbacteria bacterium]
MRATEETYYNLKRLHVVFVLSAAALLGVTVWMLAVDHGRPWKEHQRTFRDRIEPWMTAAQIDLRQDEEFLAREKELAAAVDEARKAVADGDLIERFGAEIGRDAAQRKVTAPDLAGVKSAYESLGKKPSVDARDGLLQRLREFVVAATLREENRQRQLRFRRAEFDQARSFYEAAVGENKIAKTAYEKRLKSLQAKVDTAAEQVDRETGLLQQAGNHRRALEAILAEITADEDAALAALAAHRAELHQLQRTLARQRPNPGKRALQSPMIDALGRPLAIDQIWLPELTIDYGFRRVARFDRCVTCHQGIDKTVPQQAFGAEKTFAVELATPKAAPEPEKDDDANESVPSLQSVYGLVLARQGLLDPQAATVARVLPRTAAADARLALGDVIVKVGEQAVGGPAAVEKRLLEKVAWGKPLELEIRRGLPQPYCSHPRPDLFVGSLSPHPVAEFGCTICHDGQGSATDFTFASHTPDDPAQRTQWREQHDWQRNRHWNYPMLPGRFAESRCLKCHHDVVDLEPSPRYPDPPAAKLVAGYELVRRNGCFGCHEINGFDESGRRVGPDVRLEPAGTMRKLGPSLRDVKSKVDEAYLADRIADPRRFLPEGRMPRLYGLHNYLDGRALADAKRFEAVEIRAIVAYLLAESRVAGAKRSGAPEESDAPEAPEDDGSGASQAQPPATPESPATVAASADRGKRLFQLHGCLACHQHEDFPKGQSTQGPDLSSVGAKYTVETARQWLVGWIRDPHRHSPRTLMPNPLLEPTPLPKEEPEEATTAEDGDEDSVEDEPKPRPMTDPAADLAAYLLGCNEWTPGKQNPLKDSDLDDLALMHLKKTAAAGPGGAPARLKKMTRQEKLHYVGLRTITKRGCYGCHDVAGFEAAGPIGPALTDWGRKQESLLAFEQINRYIESQQAAPDNNPDVAFFRDALLSHRREGFLWQKLRGPRSFDFKKAHNKPYNDSLTMGRFGFTQHQIEAIGTFVLGLVAEPPAEQYVYRPQRRQRAIVEGRKVLRKYACTQCHALEMERWTLEFPPDHPNFDPDELEDVLEFADFKFLKPQISAEQIDASRQTDARGLCRAEIVGMPRADATGALLEDVDDDDYPLYFFTLWEPAVVNGMVWTVGGMEMMVSEPQIVERRGPVGGEFARLLYPVVLREAQQAGSTTAEMEAWGWVPPPLSREGAMVRPAWLHDYLLRPVPIRPAVVLRMPQYNLSPEEAGKLVDYFAAVAGVEFPYSSAADNMARVKDDRHDEAINVLIDTKTFCAKCHLIGDFSPGGEVRTILAPDLEQVGRRIRPEYIRRWLANPKSALPYTGMPVNFPPRGDPMGQDLLPGSSVEQLDVVADLLRDYDAYLKRKASIRKLIEQQSAEESTEESP